MTLHLIPEPEEKASELFHDLTANDSRQTAWCVAFPVADSGHFEFAELRQCVRAFGQQSKRLHGHLIAIIKVVHGESFHLSITFLLARSC